MQILSIFRTICTGHVVSLLRLCWSFLLELGPFTTLLNHAGGEQNHFEMSCRPGYTFWRDLPVLRSQMGCFAMEISSKKDGHLEV